MHFDSHAIIFSKVSLRLFQNVTKIQSDKIIIIPKRATLNITPIKVPKKKKKRRRKRMKQHPKTLFTNAILLSCKFSDGSKIRAASCELRPYDLIKLLIILFICLGIYLFSLNKSELTEHSFNQT